MINNEKMNVYDQIVSDPILSFLCWELIEICRERPRALCHESKPYPIGSKFDHFTDPTQVHGVVRYWT